MKQHSLLVRSVSVGLMMIFFLASCKKVNEATELGGDLIPPVDNINTFDTTLEVLSYNFPFTTQDSSRSSSGVTQFIGAINNDPLFGKSTGTLFLQLKPADYTKPFAFTSKDSLIGLDSVVLVLSHRTVYGDTTLPQQFQVFEMDQSNTFRRDSFYLVSSNNFTYSNAVSAVQSVLPSALNDSLRPFREAAANQLRLRLNNDFGRRLLQYDTTNAYRTDSAFNTFFKGFAVAPQTNGVGNALIGVNLGDTNTKLAFYYRYVRNGQPDTTVSYFRLTSNSAMANYIQRDRTGSAFAAVAGDNTPDPLVYIQNTPGTYAMLRVPGLTGLTNRVVHRAELIVQQVPDQDAALFPAPTYMYLDAFDPQSQVYKTIPVDLQINSQTGQPNYATFGMIAGTEAGTNGVPFTGWRFDISRYIQRVANGTLRPYEFRLFSPYAAVTNFAESTTRQAVFVNPVYGAGRVRVGGGNHPTQPMRLRIVYSKL